MIKRISTVRSCDKNMLNRNELIDLVQELMDSEGAEKELDDKLELLKNNVTDPNVSDYILLA